MSILRAVFAELVGMFLADAWMSLAILAVVALSAGLIATGAPQGLAAAVLVFGALAVPIVFVIRSARGKDGGRSPR